MKDNFNDHNEHPEEQSTVIPRKKLDYTAGYEAPAKEATFDSADILRSAREFSLKPEKEESVVMNCLMGILGACIGAIPGFLLWIIIGRVGFIASICGMVLALGAIGGCSLFTKNKELSAAAMAVIVICVIFFAVYLAEKVVWCMEMSDAFQKYASDLRAEMYRYGDGIGAPRDHVDSVTDTYIKEEFGFVKGNFGDFFFNFSKTLSTLEMKARYTGHMFQCYAMAALGGVSYAAKFFKTNI